MKTLIAHDRAEVAEVIKAALGKLEIGESEVQIAEAGVHTRELLRSTLFDLVVLDLTLPHIKGKSQPDYTIVENLLIELFD